MKKYIKIMPCALLIVYFHESFAMMTRVNQARQRLTTQQLATQRALLQTQTRSMTRPIRTAPIAKATPAPTSSTGFFARIQNSMQAYWDNFKNMFSSQTNVTTSVRQAPIIEKSTIPLSMPIKTEETTAPDSAKQSLFTQLSSAKSLKEMKTILKNQETVARNKLQKLFNISSEKWQNAMKRIESLTSATRNYLNNPDGSALHSIMPPELYDRVVSLSQDAGINASSLTILWQKIVAPDVFGHKNIIVSEDKTPTIIIDPNSALLPTEQFDAELIETLGHLTEGHNQQVSVIRDVVGLKEFNNYIKNPTFKEYLDSLRNTAVFYLSLANPKIAKIMDKSATHKAFEFALEIVDKRPTEPHLSNSKQSSIKCPYPGKEIRFLMEVKALPEFLQLIAKQRETIIRSMGFDDAAFKDLQTIMKTLIEQFDKQHRIKKEVAFVDASIDSQFVETIKDFLRAADIEPSSIAIKSITAEDLPASGKVHVEATAGDIYFNESGSLIVTEHTFATTLKLSSSFRSNNAMALFCLAHEIGHLKSHHELLEILTNNLLPLLNSRADDNTLQLLWHKFYCLAELEADIYLALHFPQVAKIIHQLLENMSHHEQAVTAPGDIYLNVYDRLHLFNKIVALHENKPGEIA